MDVTEKLLASSILDEGTGHYFPWGLHLNDEVWARYGVASILESAGATGKGHGGRAVRAFAAAVNADAVRTGQGREPVRSGHLLTAGLVQDILRYLIHLYCIEQYPGVSGRAREWLAVHHGEDGLQGTLAAFVHNFPPEPVALGQKPESEFLNAQEGKIPNAESAMWEMVLLTLALQNPAMNPFNDLFDDYTLRHRTTYTKVVSSAETYFASLPKLDGLDMPLFEALRAPSRHSPDSLEGQLEYILERWTPVLPKQLLERLRVARGVLTEESMERGMGPGPSVPLEFRRDMNHGDYPEPERFTIDKDWMSNVVLLAKSTYVWLDQLAKTYHREVKRLDQVPDEELDRLARWGFNGLWLIGVWERSQASQWVKQRMGNNEALASAYSLYDYNVANDLGGRDSYENLKARCAERGIRLASDMVPNHVGLYSRWVIEHPEWFVQLNYPPYPSYTFNGPNLSGDDRVTLQIEDGYWDQRDAAVVFKRTDNWTGDVRYIYHGNDGTSMPWNDTAQLNYLNSEVREAVIQTILHVARMFPIIRFDAAMTLAKRHYQRLWFPKPGDGGAVPSRAEHGMSKEQFDEVFPEEFWREVVDRVQEEVPDTLLLAEAFWLMEGYFVRTLGMHRVYNSAFMNMLKMEDNQKYRLTIKNVLEFSPEVMKRFVNFMSNPDERTAVEQFGKGDKYLGCCMLMVTLPGLPMFGHGQVEGYTEKYGMEYGRAYWDERPDEDLIRRHEREIFPLMKRRHVFSGVENFVMFDYHSPEGWVNENVFAYANRAGGERALVLYNNTYGSTSGWIHVGTAINRGSADHPEYARPSIAEALGARADDGVYYLFRDYRENLEYIRNGRQLVTEGLYTELQGYQYKTFLDWREVFDEDGTWGALAHRLAGRGVPDMEMARRQMQLSPLLESFRGIFNADRLAALIVGRDDETVWADFDDSLKSFLEEIQQYTTVAFDEESLRDTMREELELLWTFGDLVEKLELPAGALQMVGEWYPELSVKTGIPGKKVEQPKTAEKTVAPKQTATPDAKAKAASAEAETDSGETEAVSAEAKAAALKRAQNLCAAAPWSLPVSWIMLRNLAEAFVGADHATEYARWLDDWLLTPAVAATLGAFHADASEGHDDAELIMMAVEHGPLVASPRQYSATDVLDRLMEDTAVREYARVNRYKGITYVSKEQLEALLGWLFFVGTYDLTNDGTISGQQLTQSLAKRFGVVNAIREAADKSGYRIDLMARQLEDEPAASPARDETEEDLLGG
jgi:glycosidase